MNTKYTCILCLHIATNDNTNTTVVCIRDHPWFSAFSQAYREYTLYIPPPPTQKCAINMLVGWLVSSSYNVAIWNCFVCCTLTHVLWSNHNYLATHQIHSATKTNISRRTTGFTLSPWYTLCTLQKCWK